MSDPHQGSDRYQGLAADYDWIFDDAELAGGAAINQPATAPSAADRPGRRRPRRCLRNRDRCGGARPPGLQRARGRREPGDGRGRGGAVPAGRSGDRGSALLVWEKLHAERRIVQIMNGVRARGGRRCTVLYAWEVPDRLVQEHIAHLLFLFEDGDRTEPREYRPSFRPFMLTDLRERLKLAGLRETDTDYDEAADRYSVIAVAT